MASRDLTPAESGTDSAASGALRIVVADDDALLREGLASLLQDAGHQVVGRGRDAPDLLLKVRSYVPDIAIVDVRMPPGNADDGLLAAAAIRREHPSVSVLVLSQHVEPTYMLELVGDDASGVGYLLKDRVRDVAQFLEAVERVATGGTAFDPAVVNSLVGGRRSSLLDDLTDRERDVLTLLAEGRSNRAIAKQMFLSPRAIERHVQGIFEKLRLPGTEDDNRRVLAVLALLGR
jgi:DNA-binding NarL/FixJ family response regulator